METSKQCATAIEHCRCPPAPCLLPLLRLSYSSHCHLLVLLSLLHQYLFLFFFFFYLIRQCHYSYWAQLPTLNCYDISLGQKWKKNFTSRQDSSQELINLTHLPPCGQACEFCKNDWRPSNFFVIFNKPPPKRVENYRLKQPLSAVRTGVAPFRPTQT